MCPSYRVTRDERDVTRGRANSLRLAITGQLGPDALASDEMAETLKLCVSCKACRRECPTGVDMARMKIEVLAARAENVRAVAARPAGRLAAALRADAPRVAWLMNLRDRVPGAAQLSEAIAGFSARRELAAVARRCVSRAGARSQGPAAGPRWCSSPTPSTAISSARISTRRSRCWPPPAIACISRSRAGAVSGRSAAGARSCRSARSRRRARRRARARGARAVHRARRAGHRARAELPVHLPRRDPGAAARPRRPQQLAAHSFLFEEFLAREAEAGRLDLPLEPIGKKALLHGHCHQKSSAPWARSRRCCKLVPGLEVETVESSCCGMAGAFGYGAETIDVSLAMGELSLLPAVRKAAADDARSSPTAPPAGTRSRTAPAARRCMSRACWR